MTQSFSCWNHLKSFLRSHLVTLAWSLWESFEIIFHQQTWANLITEKKFISGLPHNWWFYVKVLVMVIQSIKLIFSLSHLVILRAWITTLSQSKYIKKEKGNIDICSLTHQSFSSIKQVTLNWANQNIYC